MTVTVLLALVLTFFCLKDGDRFSRWLLRWTTGTVFVHIAEVSSRSWRSLSAYVSSQATVALVDAGFIGLGSWILGVPLALPLAVLIFFAGFLPVIAVAMVVFQYCREQMLEPATVAHTDTGEELIRTGTEAHGT